ncbi:MAG: 5-formyltetrahydrofolate cyclo-ligase [Candidatus Helarchaeota archaeon]
MEQKTRLRQLIKERKAHLEEDIIRSMSMKIIENLQSLNEYKNAKLFAENKRIAVPITLREKRNLLASEIMNVDELEPSYFSVLEPKKDFVRPIQQDDIDIILVPGLAFDRRGYRLGYGYGYYDNFLTHKSANTLTIGLGFHFQVVPSVPKDGLDVPVDKIITEKEIITCSR